MSKKTLENNPVKKEEVKPKVQKNEVVTGLISKLETNLNGFYRLSVEDKQEILDFLKTL